MQKISFTFVKLAWLVLAGCALTAGCCKVVHPVTPALVDQQDVEIGLCEDYPPGSRTIAAAERDLDLMRDLDVHVLRFGMAWDSIETSPGHFDWSFWDAMVDAAGHRGIRLTPYLCYTPRWASSEPKAGDYWRYPPADDAAFGQFVLTAAERYRGSIHSWELWNEPDNSDYWKGTSKQFAGLVEAGSRGVRLGNPSALVVLGGISWNLDFLQGLLEQEHLSPDIDVINLHAYFETWIPGSIEQIVPEVNRAADLVGRYGSHQSLWLAETGYSDFRRGRYVSDVYRASYDYEHTSEYQAQVLLRTFAVAAETNQLNLIEWYRINDLPDELTVIGDVNNRHLGIRRVNGELKPAAAAIALAVRLFDGRVTCLDRCVQISRKAMSQSEIHVFEKADNLIEMVAWLRTAEPAATSVATDRRVEECDVTLPWPMRLLSYNVLQCQGAGSPRAVMTGSTSIHLHLTGGTTQWLRFRVER